MPIELVSVLLLTLLVGIGLVLLGYVTFKLATGFGRVDWAHVGRLLVLPVWLGLGILPAIYALGV